METMGTACHGLYRCLWAVRACYARWCALIQSWATLPMTGTTFILRGVKLLQSNQPWIFAQLGRGAAAAAAQWRCTEQQWRQLGGGAAAVAAWRQRQRRRCNGGSLVAVRRRRQNSGGSAAVAAERWQHGGGS